MDHQQNPGSSTKLRIQNEAPENKVEVGEVKMKTGSTNDSSSSSSSHIQVAVEENPINNLPAEMRMEILKHVDTPSLFKFRLVSREWNDMSSEILRSRPDTEIRFDFNNSRFRNYTKGKGGRSLEDFMSCLRESKNCALSYFNFQVFDYAELSTFFEQKDWTEFLSYFKNKSFKLKILFDFQIQEFEIFISKLRDLLVNKVPHLEEFGLKLHHENISSQFKLFFTEEEEDKNSCSVQLSNLKVLYANYSTLQHQGIFQDLVVAAVNLKKIEPFLNDDYVDFNVFQFLHSAGKIYCLKTAQINVTGKFLSTLKQMTESDSPPPFKLKILSLLMDSLLNDSSTWTEATSFISSLFESSKTTLTSLSLTPLGFLTSLKFPAFKNLTQLNYDRRLNASALPLQMFPSGVRSVDVFPAVWFLDAKYVKDWSVVFPQEDSIPRLPSVKSLRVIDHGISGNCISKLALMCPNLKSLQIVRSHNEPQKLIFLEVGRAIWTQMKHLESLEIDVDVDVNLPENTSFALDSCFTGISIKNCQRLLEVTQATKTLKKWGCQFQIHESELIPVREFPSILEMTDLRRLVINPYSGMRLLDRNEVFTETLSWISQEYAFKLMPQLLIAEN